MRPTGGRSRIGFAGRRRVDVRSRPKVKVMLSPPVVLPGARLVCEAILNVRSRTPVDYVSMRLEGSLATAVGAGNARSVYGERFYAKEWRSEPAELDKGEERYRVAFDLPAEAPPTYRGEHASVVYVLAVHVSIPWWPDRHETFAVPVGFVPRTRGEVRPVTVATSTDGPIGTAPFLEVALAGTQLAVGDVLVGSVSLANLRGRRVRSVDVAFVELEDVRLPRRDLHEARRYVLRVHDGTPPEGSALPFRVRVPERAVPSFGAVGFGVTTHVELRANVAWGEDIVVRVPIDILPRTGDARVAGDGWVAPVGRERRALVWQSVCERTGLANDADAERMLGSRSGVTVEIRTEQRDADFWLVGRLGWTSLGLELDVRERRWTDALGSGAMSVGDAKVDRRFHVHARDHTQARPVVSAELLGAFLPFGEVTIDDSGATLASRGSAHTVQALGRFVSAVLAAAEAAGAAQARVPVPAAFWEDEAAWRAFAERVHGRFEPGRVWIHDARLGTDAFGVGSVWGPNGALLGTTLRVAVDPPLPSAPVSSEDPSVSPAARATWNELASAVASVRVEASAITCELPGKLPDPQSAMPQLELAVALRRALSGVIAAGPFR